ncbi:hypothetical protein DPMN_053889 [Dreissena polymorpha]|uniref:Uncharacterized protein n=1 Tax=Dreissena polymorpha TaxID=45954 RepID=A0A9D4CPA7_DREPO|nr:hypothetical protein DPMN_053889 [Dreissena polymorpha]
MGISVQQWRAKIGTFSQPVKCKQTLQTLKPMGLSLAIKAVLFYLLLAQCVESNPGPPKAGRNSGTIRGRSDAPASSSSGQEADVAASLTRPPRACSSWRSTSQISITDMLHSRDPRAISETDTGDTVTDGVDQLDCQNLDFGLILLEIRKDVKGIDIMEHTANQLKVDNEELKKQNKNLVQTVNDLSERLKHVESVSEISQNKHEKIDTQMKRNNLKFHNVPEQQNETRPMLIDTIKQLLTEKLSINCDSIPIDDVFRLPSRAGNRPILVRFALLHDRDHILTAFRGKRKEGDPGLRIGEDLSPRIGRARSGYFLYFSSVSPRISVYISSSTNLLLKIQLTHTTNYRKSPFALMNRGVAKARNTNLLKLL